jgi:hypothetical protein
MPRLATFCPFCENVQHAFRKGARSDVIRAGQVVFDFDSATIGTDEDVLPAYEEIVEIGQEKDFTLGDDDEEDVAGQESKTRTPLLLQSSRLGVKQDPVHAQIDRSKLATMMPDVALKAVPTVDSLRQSLASSSGEYDDKRTSASSRQKAASEMQRKDSSLTFSGGNQVSLSKNTPDLGLTRQYWLRPNDTLTSLCLRFRVNAQTVCKLNDLPLSTATTTPHLIHTRQFLLLPEGAIQSALSSTGDAQGLQSALDGPEAQSRWQKIQRARREAQGRFRAIIAKNESLTKGKGRGDNGDVTLCDDRAAKAYISLMEAELRCIDFGDGDQHDEQDGESNVLEEVDAATEAGRRERFDTIVKQAICRWEMDSEWERQQRAMGITPIEGVAATVMAPTTSIPSRQTSWFKRLTSSPPHDAARVSWLEKVR